VKIRLLSTAALAAALSLSAAANAAERGEFGSDGWTALFEAPASGAGGGAGGGSGTAFGTWGFDASGINQAVKPGDDFFDYANGAWFEKTAIPSDKTSYGPFDQLFDKSQAQLREIIEADAAAKAPAGSNAVKVGALYNAFMDEKRIEALDAKPIAPELAAIRAAKTRDAMAVVMGKAHMGFGSSVFAAGVTVDAKHPDAYVVMVRQSGLGLPDRDYYLKDGFKAQKAAYQAYVAQMLDRIGWADADKRAAEVVAFETRIAEASWSRIESRDRDKTYNPTAVADLDKQAPGFAWKPWLNAMGLGKVKTVIVAQNTALPKIAKVYAETPVETVQAWEAFRVADQAAPYLSRRFVDARFAFRGKFLSGQPENTPRWKRGVNLVNGNLGEVVGQEYVARHFPAESKAKMEVLVANLRTALKARIDKLEWMSPETRAKAQDKLAKFHVKIGYPNKWRDYSGLKIDGTDLVGDLRRSDAFEWNYDLARLGKPVDKDEWGMTPQTVNAYYNSVFNEIVFPAAILQPPFFDPNADMAINYGGIGGVIGHEITHGFDDQGRKSNGDGVLADWWTAEDAAKFKTQAARLGAQYDSYEVAPGSHVQGGLTMGENIGDLGGILLALDAYHASLNGQPAPVVDGFTGDQRVFFGWAQVWREKSRLDALKQQVVSDPHSPAHFRVVGPMRNVDAWYEAFGVKPGDKYYVKPEDRVRIW
jgi:putative endopeptidase